MGSGFYTPRDGTKQNVFSLAMGLRQNVLDETFWSARGRGRLMSCMRSIRGKEALWLIDLGVDGCFCLTTDIWTLHHQIQRFLV